MCAASSRAALPGHAAPAVTLSVLESSQLAQYADEEGTAAYVVYFVAQAAFSRPPLNFTAEDLTVANGKELPLAWKLFHEGSDCGLIRAFP